MPYMRLTSDPSPQGDVTLDGLWNKRGQTIFADGIRVANPSERPYRFAAVRVAAPPEPGGDSTRTLVFEHIVEPGTPQGDVLFPNADGIRTITVIENANGSLALQEEVTFLPM